MIMVYIILEKTFILDAQPRQFVIHVSADNRYKLFVNGEMVSFGYKRRFVSLEFLKQLILPLTSKKEKILLLH